MKTLPVRHFADLSNLEREGVRRIARALMRDGMAPEGVIQSLERRRQVWVPMHVVQALQPRQAPAVADGAPAGRRGAR